MKRAICLAWEESEIGWGVRPEGYSLHLSQEDCNEFVAEYWARMPSKIPYAYFRPSGDAYKCAVSEQDFAEISSSKNGIMRSDRNYPTPC